ncbi:ROK family transcriptional regulator [Amycolatopsis sp. WAC 04169]|uniref:ROK family transcriptional regulator n=1 Tax=Amycolatopsis sp. WAC 04169 TaxID=2203197 RepID=UPI000F77986D|nr:ROK family transcriptional regulator [Amycolatopsis sp. WAC 04169]RSN36830.1 ROK family transcriptional regulator [Amycolatopsis sp. WAC 04169]
MSVIRTPSASPSTARAINDRLALDLLHREGSLTAAQLKTLTGLSRPTVADLVERLQDAGLIEIVGEAGADRRGPNAKLYGIVAERAYLAGLDVRTHGIAVSVADLLGRTRAEASLPFDLDVDTDEAVERAIALLKTTTAEAGASALHTIAVGAPGLVDPATGGLRHAGGLPAWHGKLVDELRRRLGVPVLLENEVNLAAAAEQRLGAARDRDTFVLLWLGFGVGAAVVLDGSLRRGASGGAGEIGFLPMLGPGRLPTATDCDGGFHTLAGSAALCELARAHGIPASPADAAAAAEAAIGYAIDSNAEDFLEIVAERIAIGAAAVTAVLDPGCLVLGGEIGRAGGDALAARVSRRLSEISPLRTEVRAGTVGGGAVLEGAVLTAMGAAQDALFTPRG